MSISIFSFVLILKGQPEAAPKHSSIQEAIQDVIVRIEARYPVELLYRDIPEEKDRDVLYQQIAAKDYPHLFQFLRIFEEEISKYPVAFFNRSRIEKIYFVKRMFLSEDPMEGAYSYDHRVIFLGVDRGLNKIRKRHNIHHELFHMVEHNMSLSVLDKGIDDRLWQGFNDQGFEYGEEDKQDVAHQRMAYSSPPEPGFVTLYSLKSSREDRAEIFACLMVKSQNKLLHKWQKTDKRLERKVNYIKWVVYRFCPEMDQAYWESLFS